MVGQCCNIIAFKGLLLNPVQGFADPQLLSNTNRTFQNVLKAMQSQRERLTVLLSDNGDYQFKLRFQQLVEQEIADRLQSYGANLDNDIPREYAMALLVGSLMDLIIIWLQKKKPESTTEFATILTRSRMVAPLELLKF